MTRRPWTENPDFYHSSWKSMRLLVHLDLGASEVAPLPSHPVRLQARYRMRAPGGDGLRSPAEAEALFALEDLLTARFRKDAGALFVGRLIGGGDVTLIYYAPRLAEADVEALSDAVRELRGGYEVLLSATEDPAWVFYFDVLFPDVYNLQVMLNRRRLLVLEEHGDDGTRARPVDHTARFASREQAESAIPRLEGLGFEVDPPEYDPELEGEELGAEGTPTPAADAAAGEGPGPWVLAFGRCDALAKGHIDDVCVEILDVLMATGGHYEGWGTEYVKV